jgi:predicted transcriptional regulator
MIQVRLPETIQDGIDSRLAAGRIESTDADLIEASRRLAVDLAAEEEIVAEAEAGIADAEAGRYKTIDSPGEAEALHAQTMARLLDRLEADQG